MSDFDHFVATHVDDLLRTALLDRRAETEGDDLVQESCAAGRVPRGLGTAVAYGSYAGP